MSLDSVLFDDDLKGLRLVLVDIFDLRAHFRKLPH